jgi:uncharacterized membrane protein (GlpM family)
MQDAWLKVAVTPALITAATLAGRRWGEAVGGWFVALPLTSGPVLFMVALERGSHFAVGAAGGALAGTVSQAGFCLGYFLVASRRGNWPTALAGGSCAFVLISVLLKQVPIPVPSMLFVVTGALVVVCGLLRASSPAERVMVPASMDLLLRTVLATTLVIVLTGVSSAIGPWLTGLLATFPVFGSILTVFAHRSHSPAAALQVLRGLALGLFSTAGFFFAVWSGLDQFGLGLTFAAAAALALTIQAISLQFIRHRRSGAGSSS